MTPSLLDDVILKKAIILHVNKSCGHQTWTTGRFRGTDSIQTILKDNADTIFARSCNFDKKLHFSFMKDYVDEIVAAKLETNTN